MEPDVTPQDLAMLLLSQQDLVALGAMLGLRARMSGRERSDLLESPDEVEFGA
jgi:hypothetical protein